jgi:hypothetical protein
MKMNFNLANTKGTAVTRLKAWNIYTVAFKGVELKTGTTSEGKTWKAMQFNFEGPDGIYSHMVFCPGEDGDKRVTGSTAGRDWELPSALEVLTRTIAHVTQTLAPESWDKLQTLELDLPKDFEKLVTIMQKALAKAVNKETQLKLVGNNKGYATIPNFISINKDKVAYVSNNWLGDKLGWTAYEEQKMKKAKDTTPTAISEDKVEVSVDNEDSEDVDFDI